MIVGLGVQTSAAKGADPVAEARRAEALGFAWVSASDHLHGTSPTYEPWTLLTWIAASTSTIKVATRVLGAPYRNPAVVAKMSESLQRLSGGRLVLGMGGGAVDAEFRAFGIAPRSPGEKVEGMEDAIRIVRGLWSEEGYTHEGRLHRTEAATIEPKPEAPIPIWLGTYGPRALAVTGRLADGWIPSLDPAPPEMVPAMQRRIDAAAEAAGRDPRDVARIYNMEIRVQDEPDEREGALIGPPEALVERLRGFAELGFDGFNFILHGPGRDEQAERLAAEVLPDLRGD